MYKVEFTESAVKQLKKLDKQTVRVIKNWVIKNLVNTPDPRLHGKALHMTEKWCACSAPSVYL